MARWYAAFGHSSIPTQETDRYANPRFIGANSTAGNQLKSDLISARLALSNAVYAQLETANINGALNVTIPRDVITLDGSNLSWTNLYTTASAAWQSDPSVRLNTREILVSQGNANLVALDPADPGTISRTTYDTATSVLSSIMSEIRQTGSLSTGFGPYAVPGLNLSRTIFSIFIPPSIDFVGWDDFTPGQIQGTDAVRPFYMWFDNGSTEIIGGRVTVNIGLAGTDNVLPYVQVPPANFQFYNDANPNGKIGIRIRIYNSASTLIAELNLGIADSGAALSMGSSTSGNGPTNPRQGGASTWSWDHTTYKLEWSIGLNVGTDYSIESAMVLYDATIPSHVGSTAFLSLLNNAGATTYNSGIFDVTAQEDI